MYKLIFIFLLSIYSFLLDANEQVYESSFQGVVVVLSDNGFGTGAIISSKGHILTNWHVINGADEIEIAIHPSYEFDDIIENFFKARVIKQDMTRDLALLKIDQPLPQVKVLRLSKVVADVGEEVHAIGHPDMEIWSYTKGYVSQKRVDYEWSYKDNTKHQASVYQTQTPIGEGNSGGPLLNQHGNIIGINTFGSPENEFQNYAVSVNEIIKFLGS